MKRLFVLAAIAGAALAVAACGGGGGGKGGANGQATTVATKATAATSAPTAAPTKASSSATGNVPDACSLVTADELAQIAAGAGQGQARTEATTKECYYSFGQGLLSLTVSVTGLSSGQESPMKLSLQSSLQDAGNNGREVAGIGAYAVYTSLLPIEGRFQAIVNGLLLDLTLNGTGARGLETQLIQVAKAAAGRL